MRSPLNDGDQQQVSESGTPRVRERECKMKNEKHIKNNDDTKLFFYSLLLALFWTLLSLPKKKTRDEIWKNVCTMIASIAGFFLLMQYFFARCRVLILTQQHRRRRWWCCSAYQAGRQAMGEFRTFRCLWLFCILWLAITDDLTTFNDQPRVFILF